MQQGREYWSRHVETWRGSGLTKKAYCEQHGVPYWSLCRWAGKLSPSQQPQPPGQRLVELEPMGGGNVEQGAAIELVVGERYVLRLRPNLRADHLREVLAVLESLR